jgi:branched-chain amino acid transport system permease protein
VGIYLLVPWFLRNDFWASVLTLAGITAIGALGLNLLTGYTGLPSLGTAAFIGLGAFTASYLGRPDDYGGHAWPFPAYLLVALALGGLVGFVVGIPALRLRGNYLSIATLGLVFVALYAFKSWEEATGGNAGASMPTEVRLFGLDFANLEVFGKTLGRNQGLLYLVWAFVGLVVVLSKNVVRSRPGRALQAVRDRDVAAEVVGVSLFRSKVGAFVLSSAIATMAGVFYGIYIQYLVADEMNLGLNLSIQYLAVIIVGGIATLYGPVLGALLIGAIPVVIDDYTTTTLLAVAVMIWLIVLLGAPITKLRAVVTSLVGTGLVVAALSLPVTDSPATESGISKPALQAGLNAVLIIVFLVTEPNGLAGMLRKVGAYFRSWPLSR